MQSGELSALCALHSIRGIGNRTLTRIYQQQVPFTEIYSAPAASLKNFGLKPNTIDQLLAYRARHDMHEQISGYQGLVSSVEVGACREPPVVEAPDRSPRPGVGRLERPALLPPARLAELVVLPLK